MHIFRFKKLMFGLIFLIIAGTAAYILFISDSKGFNSTESSSNNQIKQAETKPKKIRIIASGDMLPHETVNQQAKADGSYNYRQFFDRINPVFKSADIRFCNQESPSAPDLPVTTYPSFNAPRQFAQDLSSVGCNVVSLANNHLFDKGQAGINGTRGVWDEIKPLAVNGANRNQTEQGQVAYFKVKEINFAFVAYSEISNKKTSGFSLNMLNEALIKKHLAEAKTRSDFVIVSAHWGTEYNSAQNPVQERWAKLFADNGVDFVFGSGPHVLQPVKKLPKLGGGETVVYFSLGNLLSSQLDIESLIGGLAVLDVDVASKKIETIGFYPTYMHYEWTPEEKVREDLLKRKNLMIYPLESAAEPLSKSQNKSSVDTQTTRVTEILNKFTTIKIFKTSEL